MIIHKPLQLPRRPERELERGQARPERPHDPDYAFFQRCTP